MKAFLFLLLIVLGFGLETAAQTKVIDEADTARYGISRRMLLKQYPTAQRFFQKRQQEVQKILGESFAQFGAFAKKVNLPQYKLDFLLMETYEPTGEAKYVLVEWRKTAPDSIKQTVLALLSNYYQTKRVIIESNMRFSVFNGYEANPVVRRTTRKERGAINTLEAAEQTTRPDTVRILNLSSLKLTRVPDAVYRFTNLNELDLSKNSITSLPARLTTDLPKLERLSFLYNTLTSDSVFFESNKHLKSLNIQGNELTTLPASIRKNRRLESLWLGNGKLKTIDFRGLRRLNDLNLYNAGLDAVPPSIAKLKRLKVLDLYYNNLTELPARLGRLRRLEQLALSHNKLKNLPTRLSKLKKLQMLYAHHNEIGTLPDRFDRLRRLRLLDLGYNFFSTSPPVLDRIGALEDIDLSGNNLQELSPGLSNLPNLKKLYLRNNPITDDKGRLGSFTQTIQQLEARQTEVFH
jgi:Leucine-rich repeat (LRR) protein